LILLDSCKRLRFGPSSHVLDFAGLPRLRRAAINKVIHTKAEWLVNVL
jgi:hypothetical protein